MQIFEFQFNPKEKDDLIFDSFCYEPENVYEKRTGSLYMMGVLKNVLPQNTRFLDKLAKQIKEKFYKAASQSPEKALKDSLKKANEYLEKTAKMGDVSWLGNLSFSAVALKEFELNFTKTGDIKIYLIRKGQIIDTDQKLDFGDFEPYPLKIFGNIVSGKLAENDIILVLTQSMSDAFFQEKIMVEVAKISTASNLIEEAKRIRDVFGQKKDKLTKTTGAALLIVLSKEQLPRRRETIAPKKKLKTLSIKNTLSPILKIARIPHINIKLPNISFKKKFKITPPRIIKPEIILPKKSLKLKLPKAPKLKIDKKTVLLPILFVFLLLGYLIFQLQSDKNIEEYKIVLTEAKEKIEEAESYLLLEENSLESEKEANRILTESWEKINLILEKKDSFPSSFSKEVSETKEIIFSCLSKLNKLTEIESPELFYEFKEYSPNKIVFSKNLYFSQQDKIIELTKEKEISSYSLGKEISFIEPGVSSVFSFLKPNTIYSLNEELKEKSLNTESYNFIDMDAYIDNLYFLDEDSKIIKYPYSNGNWGNSQLWAQGSGIKSIAVDGSVWALTNENEIKRYYGGLLQATHKIDIFPKIENISGIFTLKEKPYLYLIEPVQKRIIILNKSGELIKQIKSNSFENISNIALLKSEQEFYVLSGSKVYKISM